MHRSRKKYRDASRNEFRDVKKASEGVFPREMAALSKIGLSGRPNSSELRATELRLILNLPNHRCLKRIYVLKSNFELDNVEL